VELDTHNTMMTTKNKGIEGIKGTSKAGQKTRISLAHSARSRLGSAWLVMIEGIVTPKRGGLN